LQGGAKAPRRPSDSPEGERLPRGGSGGRTRGMRARASYSFI